MTQRDRFSLPDSSLDDGYQQMPEPIAGFKAKAAASDATAAKTHNSLLHAGKDHHVDNSKTARQMIPRGQRRKPTETRRVLELSGSAHQADKDLLAKTVRRLSGAGRKTIIVSGRLVQQLQMVE